MKRRSRSFQFGVHGVRRFFNFWRVRRTTEPIRAGMVQRLAGAPVALSIGADAPPELF